MQFGRPDRKSPFGQVGSYRNQHPERTAMTTIRRETPADIESIRAVNRQAFGGEDESRLVDLPLRSTYSGPNFMARALQPGALDGVEGDVCYPPPFEMF